jgi:hypothetical protein
MADIKEGNKSAIKTTHTLSLKNLFPRTSLNNFKISSKKIGAVKTNVALLLQIKHQMALFQTRKDLFYDWILLFLKLL